MSTNTILTNDMIYKLTLMNLDNTDGTLKAANRNYEKKFIKGVGSSVRIGIPVMFRGRTVNTISSFEDVVEREQDLTIDGVAGESFTFTQQELSRDVTNFDATYVKPLVIKINSLCNAGIHAKLKLGICQTVGNSNTPVSGFGPVDAAVTRMQEMAIPNDDWYLGVSPKSRSGIKQGTLNNFTPMMNDKIIMRGSLGEYDGMQVYLDQQVASFTSGSLAGTPLVASIPTDGTNTIMLKGFTPNATNVLRAGDVVNFAGVYYVNPEDYQTYGYLAGFNVQANVNADSSGNATVTVNPGFDYNNQYQYISGLPQVDAAVTLSSASPSTTFVRNIAFAKDCITFAAPPQVKNPGAVFSQNSTSSKTGLTIGMNVAYDVNENNNLYRWDTYYGVQIFNRYGTFLYSSV